MHFFPCGPWPKREKVSSLIYQKVSSAICQKVSSVIYQLHIQALILRNQPIDKKLLHSITKKIKTEDWKYSSTLDLCGMKGLVELSYSVYYMAQADACANAWLCSVWKSN